MSENITKATVTENHQSTYAVTIEVSGHKFQGDEPLSSGGGGLGPSPYDLLTAALGECTAMTVRWYAKQQNWPLEHVEVAITHEKKAIEGRPYKTDVFEKRVVVQGDGLSPEQIKKLHEISAKCPTQRTLEGSSIINSV